MSIHPCINIFELIILIDTDRVGVVLDSETGAGEGVGLALADGGLVPVAHKCRTLAEFCAVAVVDVEDVATFLLAPCCRL